MPTHNQGILQLTYTVCFTNNKHINFTPWHEVVVGNLNGLSCLSLGFYVILELI